MVARRVTRVTRVTALVAVVFVLSGLVFVHPGRAKAAVSGLRRIVDGQVDDWAGEPTSIPGTANYDQSVWSYTDYPYDDKGTGAFTYPADPADPADPGPRYGGNAADPVIVQIEQGFNSVQYLIRLSSLIRPDSTVIGLASTPVTTNRRAAVRGRTTPRAARPAGTRSSRG